MSFLKNIKSLFIEETPSTEKEVKKDEKTESNSSNETVLTDQTVQYTQTYQATSNVVSGSNLGGNMDEKIFDSLMEALQTHNQEGFDFMEFKNAVKALQNMPMDDATKYRSAFATAATLGVTLDSLLQSSAYYKSVLETEKAKFDQELANQMEGNVKAREMELDQINQDILSKSEQIKKLTEEIAAQQQQSTEIKKTLVEVIDKIEITKKNFESTYQNVIQKIEEDVQKMNMYLK